MPHALTSGSRRPGVAQTLFAVSLILAMTAPPVLPAETPVSDPDVARGVSLVEDGEYEAGLVTLDAAARRLAGHPDQARDLAQAYLYLGVAYLAKGHEASARAQFREALKEAKDLKLSPAKFAPKVIEVFDQARETANKESAQAPRPGPAAGPSESKPARGGSKKGLLILGGVLAAVAGVAAAAAGGGSSSQDSRRTETFGPIAQPLGSQQRHTINVLAAGALDATLTWNEANALLRIYVQDAAQNPLPGSNRTGNQTAALTLSVTPQIYEFFVLHDTGSGGTGTYTLTVTHP